MYFFIDLISARADFEIHTLYLIILFIYYILSPFVIFAMIYFLTRKLSEKAKYIIGIIVGSLSILIIVLRNVDIYIRSGWDLEVIPLQVCHIGSIIIGLALILKKKFYKFFAFQHLTRII